MKTKILTSTLLLLTIAMMFTGCDEEMPVKLRLNSDKQLIHPHKIHQKKTPGEALVALGYDIKFDIKTRMVSDEFNFDLPYTDIEVILLHNGQPTDQCVNLENLLGGAMTDEENGWRLDDERMANIHNPPENTVTGTQVYYAGGGDDVFVSFDLSKKLLTVWHRKFLEVGPYDNFEDGFGPWESVGSFSIDKEF